MSFQYQFEFMLCNDLLLKKTGERISTAAESVDSRRWLGKSSHRSGYILSQNVHQTNPGVRMLKNPFQLLCFPNCTDFLFHREETFQREIMVGMLNAEEGDYLLWNIERTITR